MKKILFFVVIAAFLASASGCVAVVAGTAGGAGTAVWLAGKLSQDVDASRDKVAGATRSALKSLKMTVTKETRADDVTQIRTKYTDGREVWIDIRPATSSSSKVDVRVGAVGDKEAADRILKKILAYL